MIKFINLQQKLSELISSQDSTSQTSLKNDVLTQVYGSDNRGRTRGVGRLSKMKVNAIAPIRTEIEKVVQRNNVQLEEKFDRSVNEIKHTLNTFLEKFSSSQSFAHQNFTPQVPPQQFSHQVPPQQFSPQQFVPQQFSPNFSPSPQLSHRSSTPSNISPSNPTPSQAQQCEILNLHLQKIAIGEIVPGAVVHCRALQEYERKVHVICVEPGSENETVYLGSQGSQNTIKEFEGSYVAWPLILLKF